MRQLAGASSDSARLLLLIHQFTINENKAITARQRFTPSSRRCTECTQPLHQDALYCQRCAYASGICAMCGKQILDTTFYTQAGAPSKQANKKKQEEAKAEDEGTNTPERHAREAEVQTSMETARLAQRASNIADRPSFLPCEKFMGSKPGYVFQKGEQGVGYYLDQEQIALRQGRGHHSETKSAQVHPPPKPTAGDDAQSGQSISGAGDLARHMLSSRSQTYANYASSITRSHDQAKGWRYFSDIGYWYDDGLEVYYAPRVNLYYDGPSGSWVPGPPKPSKMDPQRGGKRKRT